MRFAAVTELFCSQTFLRFTVFCSWLLYFLIFLVQWQFFQVRIWQRNWERKGTMHLDVTWSHSLPWQRRLQRVLKSGVLWFVHFLSPEGHCDEEGYSDAETSCDENRGRWPVKSDFLRGVSVVKTKKALINGDSETLSCRLESVLNNYWFPFGFFEPRRPLSLWRRMPQWWRNPLRWKPRPVFLTSEFSGVLRWLNVTVSRWRQGRHWLMVALARCLWQVAMKHSITKPGVLLCFFHALSPEGHCCEEASCDENQGQCSQRLTF